MRRIDDGHRHPGIHQCQRGLLVIDTRAFHDDMQLLRSNVVLCSPSQQISDADLGIAHYLGFAFTIGFIQQQTTIQFGFGDIHAEIEHDDPLLKILTNFAHLPCAFRVRPLATVQCLCWREVKQGA